MHGYEHVWRVYKAEDKGNALRFTLVTDNTAEDGTAPKGFTTSKSPQAITHLGLVASRHTVHGEAGLYYDEGNFTLALQPNPAHANSIPQPAFPF